VSRREDVALYTQQVARWADRLLTPAQREEVTCLQAQMKKLGEVTAAILSLAEELKAENHRPLAGEERYRSWAGVSPRQAETLETRLAAPPKAARLPPSDSLISL
jgi:hypothetical protein